MSAPDYKGHDNLAEMVQHHVKHWRSGLYALKCNAESIGDSDDASYLDHELKALQEIESAAQAELAKP